MTPPVNEAGKLMEFHFVYPLSVPCLHSLYVDYPWEKVLGHMGLPLTFIDVFVFRKQVCFAEDRKTV